MMNRTDDELNEILERCLLRLQSGEPLEHVLADYPAHGLELHPILETVIALWSARGSDTVPVAAMQRSRARLLGTAQKMRSKPRRPWLQSGFLRSRAGLVLLSILAAAFVLLFSGIATAQALPGETLYALKIAAEKVELTFISSPASRLEWEETFDLRRKEEVERLIKQQRGEIVNFTGYLTRRADEGTWWIDEIQVTIPEELTEEAVQIEGDYVSLRAVLTISGEMIAEEIKPRVYQVTGRISDRKKAEVTVGDVVLQLADDTDFPDDFPSDQLVRADIVRLKENLLVVLRIEEVGSEDANPPLPGPTLTNTPDPDDETRPSPTKEVEKTEKPDDKDNENKVEKTSSPEPEKTKEPEATPDEDD